jgi:hypothetical protein
VLSLPALLYALDCNSYVLVNIISRVSTMRVVRLDNVDKDGREVKRGNEEFLVE